MPAPEKADLTLVTLPAEIRRSIIEQVCSQATAESVLLSTARQGKWPNNSSPIVIVFVCKQLRREALPVVL